MPFNVDLDPGDILVVPQDSGAHIQIAAKSGRRTRVVIESAKPVQVLRARDATKPAGGINVPRPQPGPPSAITRPKS